MNKKAIAILGAIFILIVGTLGFLIFSKYFTKSSKTVGVTTPTASSTPVATATPSATPTPTPAANFVLLTSDQVVSPALFFDDSGITYFDHGGSLYQAQLNTSTPELTLSNKKTLAIPQLPGLTNILWPPKGQDFIAGVTTSTGTYWSYFNSNTATYTTLPPQVESVSWMPSGTQIMYVWLQNGKAQLNIGSPDVKTYQKLAAMWETDDQLFVSPDGSQALYYEANPAGDTNFINSVTSDGKVFKGLVKDGYNYGVLWSPDGQKFLFGKKDPSTQAFQIWEYNMTSGQETNLGLFTSVNKVVWGNDSNTIYAAVPSQPVVNQSSLTEDSFFVMDATSMSKKQYNPPSTMPIDGQNLFLDATGTHLFFRNAQDGGLYYLDLGQ